MADGEGRFHATGKALRKSLEIRALADCRTDLERRFWEEIRLPFIFGWGRLFDGAGHEGAKALAAIIRDGHANGEPLMVNFSLQSAFAWAV